LRNFWKFVNFWRKWVYASKESYLCVLSVSKSMLNWMREFNVSKEIVFLQWKLTDMIRHKQIYYSLSEYVYLIALIWLWKHSSIKKNAVQNNWKILDFCRNFTVRRKNYSVARWLQETKKIDLLPEKKLRQTK
jgi:hypothetical protein